jgi:hypothetical protein
MSIQCLKKKGVILHGGGLKMLCRGSPNISGKGPSAYWVSHLPFCYNSNISNINFATKGFSVVGGHRNIPYVGQCRKQIGTPFKGNYPKGYGGTNGRYPKNYISYNMSIPKAEIQGNQHKYIKPVSTSTRNMLNNKYKYIYHGQYPNKWVQPTYPNGPLHENASMSSYIEKLKTQNTVFIDVNKEADYEGLCKNPCVAENEGYTKTTKQPITISTYTQYIQRRCLNPKGTQKPFPFNVINNRSATINGVGGPPPAIETEYYLTPPEWYLKDSC